MSVCVGGGMRSGPPPPFFSCLYMRHRERKRNKMYGFLLLGFFYYYYIWNVFNVDTLFREIDKTMTWSHTFSISARANGRHFTML